MSELPLDEPTPEPSIAELKNANSIVILLAKNPKFEHVASGLGLFLTLERAGKRIEIACPSAMLVEFNRLVGVQKIKNSLSGRNLVISFDYVQDAIEKVSYNVDNGKFNLVVVPKAGHEPLDHTSVAYSYSGIASDLMLLVGTREVRDVKDLLSGDQIADRQMISLLGGPDQSLVSETALLLSNLALSPDREAAGNLFAGLVKETDNFRNATAVDFEVAAALVRAGASVAPAAASPVSQSLSVTPAKQVQEDWLKQPKIFTSRQGA